MRVIVGLIVLAAFGTGTDLFTDGWSQFRHAAPDPSRIAEPTTPWNADGERAVLHQPLDPTGPRLLEPTPEPTPVLLGEVTRDAPALLAPRTDRAELERLHRKHDRPAQTEPVPTRAVPMLLDVARTVPALLADQITWRPPLLSDPPTHARPALLDPRGR
jgi:hypothetical protein